MADIIQIRRGTSTQWNTTNPVLADGELGFETDTRKGKLGNGVTAWNSLPYSFTGESSNVAEQIVAAASKTTPVDADLVGLVDSAASNVLKKLSWANIKATLKTYFDTLYATISHTHAASHIVSGTLVVSRGGTGAGTLTGVIIGNGTSAMTGVAGTANQLLRRNAGDTAYEFFTASFAASVITAGTFGSGNYVFPANLEIQGQVNSPANAKGNSGTGTVTFNWNDGNIQTVTLTGSCTFAFSNPTSGASYQIVITQNGTGGFSITWPTIHWEGKTVPSLTGTANSVDVVTLTYDGSKYLGVMSKNHGTP